jgi:hypothetical protein
LSEPPRYRVLRVGKGFAVMRGEEKIVTVSTYKRARGLVRQFNRTNPSEAELEAYIAAGPRRGRRS